MPKTVDTRSHCKVWLRACNNLPQPPPYTSHSLGVAEDCCMLSTIPCSGFLYLQFLARCHPYILFMIFTLVIKRENIDTLFFCVLAIVFGFHVYIFDEIETTRQCCVYLLCNGSFPSSRKQICVDWHTNSKPLHVMGMSAPSLHRESTDSLI